MSDPDYWPKDQPECDHVWVKTVEDDMVVDIRCERCWRTPLDLLSDRLIVPDRVPTHVDPTIGHELGHSAT